MSREAAMQREIGVARAYPPQACIHHLFEAQVQRTPEAVAVIDGDRRLEYGELNRRANQLARHLLDLGITADGRVGVCMERSAELVAALLAILKAGGCYVPLDPDYPAERVRRMVAGSRPRVLLVDPAGRRLLDGVAAPGAVVLDPAADRSRWESAAGDDLALRVDPASLAYVIYTSGSTGVPKGVMNEHRGVVNRLLWMQEAYELTAADVVLQKTPSSFDVSVWEFFWPLISGARLVMARPGGHKDPSYLAAVIEREAVTTIHFVPAMLHQFVHQAGAARCTSLARVVASGEALAPALVAAFHERLPGVALHNLYGPTEAAVDVTAWTSPARAAGVIPIGRPIANTRIYIVDDQLQPAPIGVAGELYIAGVQVARGYLGQPALTAERFVADPFFGGRMYRTGDLARWLDDGNIEFLGRADSQVKLRGFRIELGEIEHVLARVAGVREVVVVAREDYPGNRQLVAYYTGGCDRAALRERACGALPEYMVPAACVQLDRMPLTANGKVDRAALPAPSWDQEREHVPPRGPVEEVIANAWSTVLGVTPVGIHDDFFDLGGYSLALTEAAAMISEALNVEVDFDLFFDHPTVAALAAALAAAAAAPDVLAQNAEEYLRIASMTDAEAEALAAQLGNDVSR